MTLAERDPGAAYRRVEVDARIAGAATEDLVGLCFERLGDALGGALAAGERHDNVAKSRELARAVAALTALQLGVSNGTPIAPALNQVYQSARRTVLASALAFNPQDLVKIRNDFAEIGAALRKEYR